MSRLNPLQVCLILKTQLFLFLQVDILFSLSDRLHDSKTLIYSDLQSLAPEQYMKQVMLFPSNNLQGDEACGGHKVGRSSRGQELDDRDAGVQLQVFQLQQAVSILGPQVLHRLSVRGCRSRRSLPG